MTAPTIRVHRDGTITAAGEAIGHIARRVDGKWMAFRGGRLVVERSLRREAVAALLDHVYGEDRWS